MSDNEFDKTHPMEELFDIEDGSTNYPSVYVEKETVVPSDYDEKEIELDDQFQEIYNEAMKAFKEQQEDIQLIDPQYRARNSEVGVQFLNAALNAANSKANLKNAKDKLEVAKKKSAKTVNNNLIVDRNDLLELLNKPEVGEIYDVECNLLEDDNASQE